MTHTASHIIIKSLLHIFDDEEYPGVRQHFTEDQLDRIDTLRALPETHAFTRVQKQFVVRMIRKAVLSAT